jgi:hypothetical protein
MILVSCISHTQSSRSSTILGLDNFIPPKLHPPRKSLQLILRDLDRGLRLAEKRDNRRATMPTDDGDTELGGGYDPGDFSGKGRGADDVEGGDAKEFFGVEYTVGFQDFGDDGDGAVDGVGDDEDEGIGTVLCDAFGELKDDVAVDLEQICDTLEKMLVIKIGG